MNDLGIALKLLGVGMITVFVVLALVVIIGDLLIRFVNKYIAEENKPQHESSDSKHVEVNSKKLSAIVSTVNIVTKGKGRVTNVEKQ